MGRDVLLVCVVAIAAPCVIALVVWGVMTISRRQRADEAIVRERRQAEVQAHEVCIPYDGREVLFPPQCVYCLAPATDVQALKTTAHHTRVTGSGRSITRTLKASIDGIPYCVEHAQYSATIRRVSNIIMVISVIVGLVAGGLVAAGSFPNVEIEGSFGPLCWSSLIVAGISGGLAWVILRQIAKVKYPIIRQFGTFRESTGLGVKLSLGGVEETADQEPRISAISLWFDNPEYARMFAEINRLGPASSPQDSETEVRVEQA